MTPEVYSGLKWGALFGGALAIFETFLILLAMQEGNYANLQLANGVLFLPLEAILPFVAGFLATRQSKEVRSALIAGVTAGLIVAVINMLTEIIYPIPLAMLPPEALLISDAENVFLTIEARIFTIGFGVFFGWLGGRMATRITTPGDKGR